jgi:hypothetical protein
MLSDAVSQAFNHARRRLAGKQTPKQKARAHAAALLREVKASNEVICC